jgi:hypothetical protein
MGTLTAIAIRQHFFNVAPLTLVICYDVDYNLPTTDWLLNKFWPWFQKTRWDGNLSKWSRKNDCDNFARAYVTFCQDAHARSFGSAEGLAVGEFCYHGVSHVKGPHAIVAAFTEEGLIFIEPQNGQRIALSPGEITSCFHAAF